MLCRNLEEISAQLANTKHLGTLAVNPLIRVIMLPEGIGLLPLALDTAQVCSWTGMKKTFVRDLINDNEIDLYKIKGKSLIAFASVIDMFERHRVQKGQR